MSLTVTTRPSYELTPKPAFGFPALLELGIGILALLIYKVCVYVHVFTHKRLYISVFFCILLGSIIFLKVTNEK